MQENLTFRKATFNDKEAVWKILQEAIERRRKDGSKQWQDGYPNPETVQKDMEQNFGYVLVSEGETVAYCAIILNYEPAYEEIEGQWLNDEEFFVIHRVAVSEKAAGKGYAQKLMEKIEQFVLNNGVKNIKLDTNFDNLAMLRILEKMNYNYCGEVYFRGSARKAFQKILKKQQ